MKRSLPAWGSLGGSLRVVEMSKTSEKGGKKVVLTHFKFGGASENIAPSPTWGPMHSACNYLSMQVWITYPHIMHTVPVRAGVEGEPQAAREPPRARGGAPTRQPPAAAVPLGQVRVPRVRPADLMRVRTWLNQRYI